MKVLLVVTLLLAISLHSKAQFRPSKLRLMIPNIGAYSANHSEIIHWIEVGGGQTSNFKFGGDLFNVTYLTESNIILGLAAGGLYTGDENSNLRTGYGDLLLGTPLFTSAWFQINILSHLTGIGYSIVDVLPPNVALPPTNQFYMRGKTFGGGGSLQMQATLYHSESLSFGIGVEYGVTFLDPDVYWKFGYSQRNANGRYRFVGTSVPGPEGDSMYSYLRFSLIIKGRN